MKRINTTNWKNFRLDSLFNIVKGSRLTKQDMKEGELNYIGATAFNNGITNYISNKEHIHPGGTLTVAYNGSIGQTFYQEQPYWATDDVNVFYPKFEMTKHIALFIAPLIKAAGRNYAYTDKWQLKDMEKCCIPLPHDKSGNPDWEYMDAYMKKIETKVETTVNQLVNLLGGG